MQNRNQPRQDVVQQPRHIPSAPVRRPKELPTETYEYVPEAYDPYVDYAPPKKSGSGARTALLILLALLLVAGGGLVTYMALTMKTDKEADGEANDPPAVTAQVSEPQTEEDTAAAQSETPSADTAALLTQMQYVGNAQACTMTANQARAFANVIRNTQGDPVCAAIFDGGNGVPILWVAHGNGEMIDQFEGRELLSPFGDKLYALNGDSVQELTWMTALLREGTDGIIVKISKDSTKMQFFRLHNGRPDANAYAVGYLPPEGEATFNGTVLGFTQVVGFEGMFQAAAGRDDALLEAISGDSDALWLDGEWLDGSVMSGLLDQYAAALS